MSANLRIASGKLLLVVGLLGCSGAVGGEIALPADQVPLAATMPADSELSGKSDVPSKRADAAPGDAMILALPAEDPRAAQQLRDGARRTFTLAASLREFECQVSHEFLSRSLACPVSIDAAFQDVLLDLPVFGQAHVDGTIWVALVPDDRRVICDVLFSGRVSLKGISQAMGVQVRSDSSVDFTAVKRIVFDHDGLSSLPTVCAAQSTIAINKIASNQPRILGRFTERIAKQRSAASKVEAEGACSAHVADAIAKNVDRQFQQTETTINAALRDYLATAKPDQRAAWNEVRFQTTRHGLWVGRATGGATPAALAQAATERADAPIMIRVPKASIDLRTVLAGIGLFSRGSEPPPAVSAALRGPMKPVALRPSLSLAADSLTIRLDFEPPPQLVHEPVPAPR